MFGKTITILAASLLFFATTAKADVRIPDGKCAFIVASRSSIDGVNSFLAGLDDSLLKNAQVVVSNNGWYAISVGVFPREKFEKIKARRVAAGLVPKDSLCSSGKSYRRVLKASEYKLPVRVDVSNWVPVGSNAPSLRPTGRAPITFNRPLRDGERPIYLCPQKGRGCQYVDTTGAALTGRIFDVAYDFPSSGIARVNMDGKWGYINTSGKWVVEPKFDVAYDFDKNGVAGVNLGDKWGFINASGKWVVEPRFDSVFGFARNDITRAKLGGKWGFINASGKWVITPKFDHARPTIHNDIAIVRLGGKWGLINTSGKWVVEPKFNDTSDFFSEDGIVGVKLGGKWGFINTKGQWIIKPRFDHTYGWIKDGFPLAKVDGKWGIINTSGDWVIKPRFDATYSFDDKDIARAQLGGKWGYIDTGGNWVVGPKFELAHQFTDAGIAPVLLDGKWGAINRRGSWVIDPDYDSLSYIGGVFRVHYGNHQYQGLLDSDGTPLTFSKADLRMANIEGNQMRLEQELAKKEEEIRRLRDEAQKAAAAAASSRPSSRCDHVYVGQRFEGKEKLAGLISIGVTYEVLGFSAKSERVTVRSLNGGNSYNIHCSQVTP